MRGYPAMPCGVQDVKNEAAEDTVDSPANGAQPPKPVKRRAKLSKHDKVESNNTAESPLTIR